MDSFVAACAALCRAPRCCCYIAMERRASSVLQAFFSAARASGFTVVRGSPLWGRFKTSQQHRRPGFCGAQQFCSGAQDCTPGFLIVSLPKHKGLLGELSRPAKHVFQGSCVCGLSGL